MIPVMMLVSWQRRVQGARSWPTSYTWDTPMVNVFIRKISTFDGKTSCKWSSPVAMLNYVKLPEGIIFPHFFYLIFLIYHDLPTCYPLVMTHPAMENHHMFNGKTHYKWPFSSSLEHDITRPGTRGYIPFFAKKMPVSLAMGQSLPSGNLT